MTSMMMVMVLLFTCNSMSVLAEEEIMILQLEAESAWGMEEDSNVIYGQNNTHQNAFARAATIVNADLRVSCVSNGIRFEVATGTNVISSEIGVKNIKVQKKVWYGWETVATSSGYDTDTDMYSGASTYTGAKKAETYRITCTHYAKGSGFNLSIENSTSDFIFN